MKNSCPEDAAVVGVNRLGKTTSDGEEMACGMFNRTITRTNPCALQSLGEEIAANASAVIKKQLCVEEQGGDACESAGPRVYGGSLLFGAVAISALYLS